MNTLPKTVLQMQQQQSNQNPGYVAQQHFISPSNPYGKPNSVNFSVPSPPSSDSTMQGYIQRAFAKCITASERLEMSEIVNKIIKANKNK